MQSPSLSNPKKILASDDVFEINDFTVVTDFEVLILSLENAIQELTTEVDNFDEQKKSSCRRPRDVAERIIEYESYTFKICLYRQGQPQKRDDSNSTEKYGEPMEEGTQKDGSKSSEQEENYAYMCKTALNFINAEGDFAEDSVIAKQYGVSSDFFLIYAIGKNNLFNESLVNIIQSAVNVATANIECELPVFFQFAHGACVGTMQNRNCFTNFEGVVMNRCLNKHRYLDGVIEMFKEKLNPPLNIENKLKISLQFDYKKELNLQQLLDSASSGSATNESFTTCSHKYPFQSIDPTLVKELWLSAIWTNLPEHYLTESDTYSNIDHQSAHWWKLAVKFDEEFSYELHYAYTRLLEHREEEYSAKSVRSLIPTGTNESGKSLAASAFGPLLDKPAINFELIPKIDLFQEEDEDSHKDISTCLSRIVVNSSNEEEEEADKENGMEQEQLLRKLSQSKSAPVNSLTRRLITCLMSRIDKNLIGFCRLWVKFLEAMRHHWEYNLDLPGFAPDDKPDLSHCLFHQKLQMIQYCIGVKRRKHMEMDSQQNLNAAAEQSNKEIGEDDEFYDASEAFDEIMDTENPSTSTNIKPLEPRGRSHPLEPPAYLKNNKNEQIYVPFTQEQGPMTEDQLEMNESFLVSLKDTNLRNKAQCELLLSDMQAFKAANPGSVLEDFLCWHSPRDLVNEELSERMKLPGNLWQENWHLARPVAAAKQNRLFNETKEVEQIFQYFSTLKLKELIDLIMPVVSAQITEILAKNALKCLEPMKGQLEKLINNLIYTTKTMDDVEAFYDLAASIRSVEEFLMKYFTLANLLEEQGAKEKIPLKITPSSPMAQFLTQLCRVNPDAPDELSLKSGQVNIPVPMEEANLLDVLRSFLNNNNGEEEDTAESEWAKPRRKQFILHWLIPHPGQFSRLMPQRMYTSYREGEFILAGTFTSDVTFM